MIISALTAFTLTASATSFASISHTETAYLFGTQEEIKMQVISTAEMQITEGQLFGITFEALGSYMDKAVIVMKPILAPAKPYLGEAFKTIKDTLVRSALWGVRVYFSDMN